MSAKAFLRMKSCRGVLALLVVSGLAAGCGTRVDSDQSAASPQAQTAAATALPSAQASTGSGEDLAAGTGGATSSASKQASPTTTPAAAGVTSSGQRPAAGSSGASAAAKSSGAATTGGSSSAGGAKSSTAPAAAKPGSGRDISDGPHAESTPSTPAAPVVGGSTVVLATVGSYSGPFGVVLNPIVQGAQVWVKHINAKGGLNGHKVNLRVYDDGGDPARHNAQVKQAVEQDHAVAFLANGEPVTGAASLKYLESKRVPVIGTVGGIDYAYTSPMYFPQMSEGAAMFRTWANALTQVKDKKKLGMVICTEANTCNTVQETVRKEAEALGFEVVYSSRATITQPDYTAECLQARNAGVEILFVGLDGNSVARLASSCVRQSYRPKFSTGATIMLDRFKDEPSLVGMIGSSTVFPYFKGGTPARDEYQRALKDYGQGVPNGVGPSVGWTAGKLLERAAARLPEPPTSQAVLAGLWSIKNDDLGGLTYPLTFTENGTATEKTCWFDIAVDAKGGSWITPSGDTIRCR